MKLDASCFADYFRAVHDGQAPFPWQIRLVKEVLEKGWPETLSLPTASGKTAVLDVAVFALACQAYLSPEQRTAPRRIALVVDRRIVVDDASRRARRIRDAIVTATEGVLQAVKTALLNLGVENVPLQVATLRGGMYREDRWARTPLQPVILCSTVDQVGSRLLFRGYGLSASMWPIHAGLLGNDCLIILDEAHGSQPFLQTLEAIRKLRGLAEQPLAMPFAAVSMTATPRGDKAIFTLDDADKNNAILKARLAAPKAARLMAIKGKKDADLATKAEEELLLLCRTGATLLAVFNQVAVARELRDRLSKRTDARKDKLDADIILLTGRSRSVERDALLEKWRPRLMAGRDRSATKNERPLIVIATQCVEVGADLDVDILLTECAALDALCQRFGRLDRLGRLLTESNVQSQAVILCREDQSQLDDAKEPADDPVYGQALAQTWRWLNHQAKNGSIDFGITALNTLLPRNTAEREKVIAPLITPAKDAPILFPAYCDLWAQTGPAPAVSPDPAIFLHGPRSGPPEVQIVWRADLNQEKPNTWADTVAFCPPVAGESLPLPLWQARTWLAETSAFSPVSDLESAAGDDPEEPTHSPIRSVLRWQGPERSEIISSQTDLRPGDLLVVPSAYGGCDAEGWNPTLQDSLVHDCADKARSVARRNAVLRLHASLLDRFGSGTESVRPFTDLNSAELPEDMGGQVNVLLTNLATLADMPKEMAESVSLLAGHRFQLEPHPGGKGLILVSRARMGSEDNTFSDEDILSASASTVVPLDAHLSDVEQWADRLLSGAGLSEAVRATLKVAAHHHDVGKADPRFQSLLYGGNRIKALQGGLRAKSANCPLSPAAIEEARQRSGYPKGGRHELLSVRLLESEPKLFEGLDRELMLHVVASHHGHCRPFAPVIMDEKPRPVDVTVAGYSFSANSDTQLERLDSGVPERFWRLVRRHGWWGLAYLEACVRLADHRASENPALTVSEEKSL